MGAKCCLLCSGAYGPYAAYARDVAKFGEGFPRRVDYNQQAASDTNSNYGFTPNYNTNRYDSNRFENSYHHYKNDDLNYRPQPPNYPYSYDDHTYQNYRNEMANTSPYRTPEYQYNERFNPYDYYPENEFNEYNYQQFSDSDGSLRRQNQASTDLYEPQGLLGGVSAGELLGKTHEELVLLLIQLRRHQSALMAARKHTNMEKETQENLLNVDLDNREERISRIAYLEEHLIDLDKQYQMGKPLINLVDNMVKLGSLYRGFDSRYSPYEQAPYGAQDSLEFSRRILEQRIVAEDRSKFDSVVPDQADLEEILERTLDDLNRYSYRGKGNMLEMDRSRQRDNMERELARLRSHLAVSARRLEETAAENNRLEHEMMMLRQKIQRNMARNLNRSIGTDESHHIESEMLRVQSLLEELQKRRLELSRQIQRLTSSNEGKKERLSPTTMSLMMKKRGTWLETDLDQMITRDRSSDEVEMFTGSFIPPYSSLSSNYEYGKTNTEESKYAPTSLPSRLDSMDNFNSRFLSDSNQPYHKNNNFIYDPKDISEFDVKTYRANLITELDRDSEGNKPDGEEQVDNTVHIDIKDADDRTKRFYGIIPKEKPLEPKTVRVVKRESTERKKDRFPSMKDPNLPYVDEDESDLSDEPQSYAAKTASLPRNYGRKIDRLSFSRMVNPSRPNNLPLRTKPSSWKSRGARSRDDCDMARALRPRNHPDVVKSTLSTRDLRINETTIDNIFGAPSKISIPERYKPDDDDPQELSAAERKHREEKATAIRKMLTNSTTSITKDSEEGDVDKEERERLLSMNQLLAKQVMQKSRMVAARAAAKSHTSSSSDDDSSEHPLPTVQQRENLLV